MWTFRRWLRCGLWAGLLLTVLGARWTVVHRSSMELPEWDQWDAEGLHLLLPWSQGQPLLPELLRPHNEHRVVLTKLLALGLTVANDGWNQRLEATVNAFLPALLATGLWAWSRRFCSELGAIISAWFLAAVWAPPIAWENLISGFHSQQFLLILLSWVAISFLPFARVGSPAWVGGTASATLALLSMASGFVAAAVVIGLVTARMLRRELSLHATWPTLAIASAIVLAGLLTQHRVAYHASLQAQTLQDFAAAFGQSLRWPAPSPWGALLLWAPWLTVLALLLRSQPTGGDRAAGWILFGLGAWVWVQAAATAYARGAGGVAPISRYLDTLLFGCAANFLALLWLGRVLAGRRGRSGLALLAAAWLLTFGLGAAAVFRRSITTDLPLARAYHTQATAATRAYLATGDRAHLDSPDIPYPDASAYADRLAHPELVRLLPASVQPANGAHPLAAAVQQVACRGPWITAAGLSLLAGCSMLVFHTRPRHMPLPAAP